MQNKNQQRLSMPGNIFFLLRIIWHEDKFLLLLLAVEAICGVAIPFFGIYLPKIAIDLLKTNADANSIVSRLGSFIAVMAFVYFLGRYASSARYWRINDLRPLLMLKIFVKSLYCDYGELESPEGQKSYLKATGALDYGDGSATSRLIPALMSLAVGVMGFVLYSGLLLALHPLIVVLLATTSLVTYFTTGYAVKYERGCKDENAVLSRKFSYIDGKTADYQFGKDIRIYNLSQLIFSLRDGLIDDLIRLSQRIQDKWYFTKIVDAVITLLRDGFAYAYLIWMVSRGRMGVSDFVFYFGAIAGFSGWLTSILQNFSTVNGAQLELSDIRNYLEKDGYIDPEPAASIPDHLQAPSITFEDVSFAYAGSGTNILDHFNLNIGRGEKIALVGVNGAGKTTLVKLLCGFYKPDQGRILINGVDAAMYKREDLFFMFAAVFQDIMILPYTLAENVALQPASAIDRERIAHCLRQAGLWDFVGTLPKGVDTAMHRFHDEKGIHLSGGQQQKLLLARALYKNAPVLILDEPTAALDPIVESELYEQYHSLVSGKTALYISHRLASTRFCDRIVYLNNGKAEEVGTHYELMGLGKGYAHMYDVQSHYYKENVKGAVPA